MTRSEVGWLLQHITLYRWFVLLFIVGVLVRCVRPAPDGIRFWYWLRLRGRNMVMTYGLRPFAIKIEALFVAVVAPTLAERGLLQHIHLPTVWQTVVGVLLLDFSFYWRHRLDHSVPALWRIHRVHHSDPDIDVTTTAFSHPFSGAMRILWQGLTITLLGVSTSAAVTYLWVEGYLGYLQHSGLSVEPADRLLRWCGVVSPLNHQIHHARDLPATDSNFGTLFSIWDRLFGTYCYFPASQISYGLAEFDAPRSQTIFSLLISPFRHLPRTEASPRLVPPLAPAQTAP